MCNSKKTLHKHYLGERADGQPKWYMAGLRYEWLADKEGDLDSKFVGDFVYMLHKNILEEAKIRKGYYGTNF